MNKERDEKLLKSWLKRKITITTSTVVAFLITGMVGATVVYGAVNIENTNGNTISNGSANGPGVSIGGNAKTQSGSDVSIGESAGKDSNSTGNSVAIGKNSRVGDQTVNQSIAIGGGNDPGQGAWAKGDQSIAIGGNTRSEGHSSIAIGGDDLDNVAKQVIGYVNAEDKRASGSIQDAMKNLTGVDILNPQYSNTMSGHGAVAVGVKAVAGHLSLALGTAANAGATGYENAITYKAVNTVAIGSGASAMLDNAIAIGGGAKADESSKGKKRTGATIKSIEYKWKGGDKIAAGDIVSFGAKGFERQLKNIAPGEVSEESTDGINGSQLYGIAKNITSENHLKFLGDDGQNDATKVINLSLEKNRLNIVGGADTTKLSDENIGVVYESGNNKAADGKDLETDNPAYQEGKLKIKLSKELKNLKSAEFKNDAGDKTVINSDGVTITPVTAGKEQVSLTKDGLNNGGNVIANVAGNLEGAKPNSTEPTTNATAPNNASTIKNNAATVGDVLQAGWNLQEKGVAKDFVKPYDTVNFIDGNGTSVAVETTNGTTSTVKYNVNVGNGLEKNSANQITIKPADKSLEVNKDGVKVKTDGTTITTDPTNGLKVVTGDIEAGTTPGTVKVTDGDNDKIATVDSVVNAVNSAAFTLKASAIEGGTRNTGSTVTTKGESIKAGNTVEMIAGKNLEVTHNKNGKITFATVENPSFETVQIGDDGPKFSATAGGNIMVSDKDGTNPVKITNVKDGDITKTSTDAINGSQFHAVAKNTIKLAGQNGTDTATETAGQELDKQGGIKFTVKSSDGKLLDITADANGDTITITPKTGTITTTKGGVPTATTTNGKLVTADEVVNALTEMGWKATAGTDGTGTMIGTGTTEELIKAGETVTFKAGDNLAIKQAGKNFIYSLNTALSGLTSAEFKDGDNKVNITPTGITITKPADTVNNQPEKTVTLNQDGLNNGGNLITNVASNLDGAKTGTIEPTTKATAPTNVGDIKNNAATVGDVLNAGWNLQGNSKDVDFVKPYDTVNFINGDGTTATVETTDNKVSIVKYSVNLGDGLKKDDTGNTISIKPADKSLEVNKDGLKVKTDNTTITTDDNKGLKVVTGGIETVTTGADSGTVKVKKDDTGKIATVDSVVNAVNSAAFTLKASATTGGTRNGSSSVDVDGEDIKAGKTIEMIAGKNLNVTHNENGKIIFATVDTPTFSTVQVGGDQGPKFSKTSDGDIKVSDKDDANPVKITNVKDGAVTDTSTDAINGSQFHKVANNTIKLAGQNGDDVTTATQTKEQNLNKQGGIKFTIKSSDGKLLEVKAADDTITLTPKTGTITTTKGGVPTATTTNGKLVTADEVVNALTEMGWKATAGTDGTGTMIGTGTTEELIKAGETVTFKAGNNLAVKQAGKEFIYSLKQELTDLTKVEVKDTAGNSVVTTPTGTTVTDKDGNVSKLDGTGLTITPNGNTNVSVTKDGIKAGDKAITNVASNLTNYDSGNKNGLVDLSKIDTTPNSNVATVGDLRNMGWVVSSNKTTDALETEYNDKVKNANEVKFVGKGAATVSGKTVDGVRTVTVDVTVPDVEKGTIEPDTGDNKGKVKSKAGDGDKFTTVDTVVNAINSAAWKATSGVEGTGTTATSGHTKSDEEIKAGDTVTFKAGDNLIIKQAGKDFTYSLAKELKDLSKVEVKDTSGNSVVTTPTGTTTTDGTNTTTVGPTGTITKDKDGNTTKVDGNGVTITPGKDDPANPGTKISDTDKAVSLTKDGLNNGGNAITNVAGNLEGAKKDTTSPKTNAAAPTNVDAIKNNAATVGDVLNAGWNLQNNGTAKDFVKPYDTVNFVDGLNTKAIVTTDADGKVSNVQIDVKDLPIAYTNESGDKVVKAADGKYYKESDLAGKVYDPTTDTFKNADGAATAQPTEVAKDNIKTNLVNPNAAADKTATTDPSTLGNVKSGLDTIKEADNKAAAGLVNLNDKDDAGNYKVSDNNVATVGDLRNMGWVVSSDKTTDGTGEYSAQVKNANEVRFVGKGTATVSGKTDTNGVRTITVEVNDQVSTNNSVTPVVYTKADGTKVYPVKKDDGTIEYHTTPDGKGAGDTVVPKNEVITSANGPEGTTTPTTLSNVAGNLDGAKTGTTAPTTNAALPNTTDKAGNNYINPNNAATVGDVLNAGWNLQGNGDAKDFVKPYDTVNFVDGTNTKVEVTSDGTVSKIQVNTVGLPVSYTTADGTAVEKIGDKYYKVDPTTGKVPVDANGKPVAANEVKPGDLKTALVNPNPATGKTGTTDPSTLNNVKSGLDNFTGTGPKTELRDLNKVGADGKPVVKDNTAATVGDLRNMGWIVSSDKKTGDLTNAYSEAVKNANEVKFVGKNGIQVSGKTDDKGVRTLTFEMEAGEVTPTEITKADGTKLVKVGDKVYNPEDIGTDGKPKQGKDPVGTIANDGKVYNNGDVVNGAPNNGANPIDGITVTPNNGSKFVTGNQVADAIEKSGFVVGKNNKALSAADFKNEDEKVNPNDELRFADGDNTNVKLATKEVLDASGKVKTVTTVKVDVVDLPVKYTDADGNIVKKGEDGKYYNPKDLDEKVYDPATKTYKNADGSALAEQPTPKAKDSIVSSLVNPNDAKDGKVGTPSTLTNVANGAKTFDPAKDADGNDLKLGNDGKWYPADKIEANGTPKADAVPVATPVNPGKAGLVDFNNSTPTNVATVGDLRNMGWVVSTSDTGYNDQVRNTNKVDFKQGTGIKISGQTTADGTRQITIGLDTGKVTNEVTITKPNGEKVNAIKVTQPDGTVKYYEKDKDGKADLKKEVPVGTGANDNKVTADDGSRVVTGNAVATAIGESGWNVGKANTKDVTKAFETEAKLHDKVNPNDDVKFVDGDNTTVSMVTIDSQNDDGTKKATTYIKTDINKDIHIDSVTTGGKNADGTPGKDGALTVKDKNGNDRVKVVPNGMTITPNKADGTPDPDKAVSLTDKGLNNGGNNITNVKSNLPQVNDSAKKAYDVNGNPIANKNNTAAPITAADAADIMKKAGNNAATVGDVLNAGWNLQENGSDRDFVKPYDTVNFVDGTNTKVTVKTNEDGTKSNVQVNIVGLPIAFADKDGNRVVQGVKDNKIVYYKMLSDGTASKEIVDPKNVQVTNVNPTDAKINTVGTPGATINNVAPAEVSPTSTQAVNGSQLYQVVQEINNVNNKVDKLGERVNKGLAGAAAMSGIEFMEIGINQATVAAAVGGYRGTHAVAVGVQAAPTENTRVNAKMSLTPGSRTEAMYSVGAAYRFNLK